MNYQKHRFWSGLNVIKFKKINIEQFFLSTMNYLYVLNPNFIRYISKSN